MRSGIGRARVLLLGVTVGLLVLVSLSAAQELTGDEILIREDESGADSEIAVSEMTIVHTSGATRVREIRTWMRGDDYTLVRFLSPANIKGTGFLSVKDDDWLYLPALRNVRRIATKERGGSFMGSDFSYDDVGSTSLVDDYTARLLRTEQCQEHECYVLELLPKETEDPSYSRLVRWVDREGFYSLKTEYYDRHGDLLKVMHSSEIEEIGGIWRARRIEMRNVQKGSRTIIVTKQIEMNPEIPDEMFTTRRLERP